MSCPVSQLSTTTKSGSQVSLQSTSPLCLAQNSAWLDQPPRTHHYEHHQSNLVRKLTMQTTAQPSCILHEEHKPLENMAHMHYLVPAVRLPRPQPQDDAPVLLRFMIHQNGSSSQRQLSRWARVRGLLLSTETIDRISSLVTRAASHHPNLGI